MAKCAMFSRFTYQQLLQRINSRDRIQACRDQSILVSVPAAGCRVNLLYCFQSGVLESITLYPMERLNRREHEKQLAAIAGLISRYYGPSVRCVDDPDIRFAWPHDSLDISAGYWDLDGERSPYGAIFSLGMSSMISTTN